MFLIAVTGKATKTIVLQFPNEKSANATWHGVSPALHMLLYASHGVIRDKLSVRRMFMTKHCALFSPDFTSRRHVTALQLDHQSSQPGLWPARPRCSEHNTSEISSSTIFGRHQDETTRPNRRITTKAHRTAQAYSTRAVVRSICLMKRRIAALCFGRENDWTGDQDQGTLLNRQRRSSTESVSRTSLELFFTRMTHHHGQGERGDGFA